MAPPPPQLLRLAPGGDIAMPRIGATGIAAAGGDHRARLRHVDAVSPIPHPTNRTPAPALPDAGARL